MIVVLPGGAFEFPAASPAIGAPVVRRPAVWCGIAPQVPVAPRIVARGTALDEPCMLIGSMVRHEVQYHLQASCVSFGQQTIEIFPGAEDGVDVAVVADVVAAIRHGRPIDRSDPNGVRAEPNEVVQPAANAFKVTDPVAIGILERAWIELVDDAALPPGRSGERHHAV